MGVGGPKVSINVPSEHDEESLIPDAPPYTVLRSTYRAK